MRKQPLAMVVACVMLITLVFMLSGCGSNPSGKYIDPNDSTVYLVFEGDKVTLHESNNQTRNGTFTESGKTSTKQYLLRIRYDGVSGEQMYWLDEDRNTITYYADVTDEQSGIVHKAGDIAFVKE